VAWSAVSKRIRPAAVGVNGGVDLGHEADGVGQGPHHLLLMVQVGKGEGAAFAVFQPFVEHLIAPHLKGPDFRGTPSKYCRSLI